MPVFLGKGQCFQEGSGTLDQCWYGVSTERVSLLGTHNPAAESALRWERSRGNRELRLFHPECPSGIRLASNIHVEWGFEQRWQNLTPPELFP